MGLIRKNELIEELEQKAQAIKILWNIGAPTIAVNNGLCDLRRTCKQLRKIVAEFTMLDKKRIEFALRLVKDLEKEMIDGRTDNERNTIGNPAT